MLAIFLVTHAYTCIIIVYAAVIEFSTTDEDPQVKTFCYCVYYESSIINSEVIHM